MLNKRPSSCQCKHMLLLGITCNLAMFLDEPLTSTLTEVLYKKSVPKNLPMIFIKLKMVKNRKDLVSTSSLGRKNSKSILLCHFHKKIFQKKIEIFKTLQLVSMIIIDHLLVLSENFYSRDVQKVLVVNQVKSILYATGYQQLLIYPICARSSRN